MKRIQSEYDTVMVNFTNKSGDHNSNFFQAALGALGILQVEDMVDVDDVLGTKDGGFCCFTISMIITYLCKCINQNQEMTGFVSRQTLLGMQIDTFDTSGSSSVATK